MVSSERNSLIHSRELSFGIMVSGDQIQAWQAECIRLLLESGHQCKLIIVDANETPDKSITQKIAGYTSKTGLYHFYQRFFSRPGAKNPVNLKSLFNPEVNQTQTIRCTTTTIKYSEYFSDNDIDSIKSHQLEFILRFGFNIIRGEILNAAKYGVWSFHHDDEQKYRGGPPGFWEIFNNDPLTGVILQQLTDKLDGGIILKKGFYKTVNHSYSGQIDQLYFASAAWPLQICIDILNGAIDIPGKRESKTKAKIFKAPRNLQMLLFSFRVLVNKIRFHFQELFKPEDWNVGISDVNISSFVSHFGDNKHQWLPKPPKGRYYADPFTFMVDDDLHIVFEDYDYRSRRGKISKIKYSNRKFGKIESALDEDFHLSYPYIFEIDGEYYCVPESADAGQIRLYKYMRGSGKFQFIKILLDKFPGVDPTIFSYRDKWWLFATRKDSSNTDLHAFYSDTFDGPYRPHLNNPVKVDIRSARPAGNLFIMNGELIRPAQDCSQTYGSRIALNKIVKLTETEFREEIIKFIGPINGEVYNDGFHTLASTGTYTIFDGKRFKFDNYNFWYKLKKKLGRKME